MSSVTSTCANCGRKVYVCAHCGGEFSSGWTDAEANAEARKAFGVDRDQDPTMAVVCDDCYKVMTTVLPPKEWLAEQLRKIREGSRE